MTYKYEDNNVAYAREYDDDLKRTIVAFANASGGKIYLGIDSFGQVIGVDEPEELKYQVERLLQETILPDVSSCVAYRLEYAEGKKLLGIEVAKGSSAPYWLSEKGLTPEGVLLRKEGINAPASYAEIRASIVANAAEDSYEARRSLYQNLTFQQAARVFDRQKIKLDRTELVALGLIDAGGAYTNLAYLISDQCKTSIRAFLIDEQNLVARESVEFSGSVFQQVEDALNFIDRNNKKLAKTREGKTVDDREYREYPMEAARAALLNSVIHRDYDIDEPCVIRLSQHKLEFLSPGGLHGKLQPKELTAMNATAWRNKKLMRLFCRVQETSGAGLGFRRIVYYYVSCGIKPKLEASPYFFLAAFPNTFQRRQENVDVDVPTKYDPVSPNIPTREEPQSKN